MGVGVSSSSSFSANANATSNGGLSNSSSSNSLSGSTKSPKLRQERNSNFKVVIRVRPPLPRELSGEIPFQNVVAVDEREQMITISENIDEIIDENGQVLSNTGPYNAHTFYFDHVYEQGSSQKKVYETTARGVADSALEGYNATIFAYGQTGTGKTFTMEGFNRDGNVENRGIIPRAIEQIFSHIQRHASPRMRFLVRASYLQIYNEQISDLLKPERSNLTIREDKKRGVFVEGLSEWVVRSPAEIYGLMERGGAVRATGETKMNEASSRSHAVFIVIAEQSETIYVDDKGAEMTHEDFQKFMHGRGVHRGQQQEMNKLEDHIRQSFKVGKLNLVDLAGSERVRLSGATGQRLEESKQINRSLSALGNVIAALTDTKGRQHIPYRDSKLTRMLEDSLGGNCRTTMMAMISPALEAMVESLSTLKFANRAKSIRNEARVNEDLDQKSLLRKYERELKKLRAELDERSKNVVDKRRLLELEEQRKQAEADKMAAIRALEARSLEFIHEKEEKKKLEQRIAMLMSQVIRGEKPSREGQDPDAPPEVQNMMKDQQEKLRQEYEGKLLNLERERETIEEEKAQVDRYKQLLLKQRDIMIALTQRLVERDEQIMALQDELDAYDRHQKELEEKLDEKTALLIKLQRISMEANESPSPGGDNLVRSSSGTSISNATTTGNDLVDYWSQQRRGGNGISSGSIGINSRRNGPTEVIQSTDTDQDNDIDAEDDSTNEEGSSSSHNNSFSSGRGNGTGGAYSNVRNSISRTSSSNAITSSVNANASVVIQAEVEGMMRRLDRDPVMRSVKEPLSTMVNQLVGTIVTAMTAATSTAIAPSIDAQQDATAAVVSQLKTEVLKNERLEARAKDLEKQITLLFNANNSISSNASREDKSTGESEAEIKSLKGRCDTLVKEREAVQTIMEQKIKVLVQSVAQATNTIMQSNGNGNAVQGNMVQSLTKDVAALQRLVNASIAALRNAAANGSNSNNSTSNSNASNSSTGAGNANPNVPSNREGKIPLTLSSSTFTSASSAASAAGLNYGPAGNNYNISSRNLPPAAPSISPSSSFTSSSLPYSQSFDRPIPAPAPASFPGMPSSGYSSEISRQQPMQSQSQDLGFGGGVGLGLGSSEALRSRGNALGNNVAASLRSLRQPPTLPQQQQQPGSGPSPGSGSSRMANIYGHQNELPAGSTLMSTSFSSLGGNNSNLRNSFNNINSSNSSDGY